MLKARKAGLRTLWYSLPALVLLLSACGDPAPGEGVEQKSHQGPEPQVVKPQEAIHSANTSETDLGTMVPAEINKVVAAGPRCRFFYTAEGKPVFAASVNSEGASGVVKVHGKLVALQASGVKEFASLQEGGVFQSEGITVEVKEVRTNGDASPLSDQGAQANIHLHLEEQSHSVDYHGWYRCRDANSEHRRQSPVGS